MGVAVPGDQDRLQERFRLLRQLGDLVATSRLRSGELLQALAELAVTTLGEGAALRILTPDRRFIEHDVVAHPEESVRARLAASMTRSAQDPVPEGGILAKVMGNGKVLSDLPQGDWRPEYQQMFTERVFDQAAHVMVAPVRHVGAVFGVLGVFRTNPDDPYQEGDDHVLQVLADGAGAAIAENRTWQRADRARDDLVADLRRRHLELLVKLSTIEAHERSLLAEAIHDEPIQRIVSGILRLDHLTSRLDPAPRAEVNDVIDHLVITVDWLRNLIAAALTPPDLSGGLGPALTELANGIFTSTPTVFTVAGPDHVPLSVPTKETAFRIFREALINTRKHAYATNVTLRLDVQDEVVISLADDGVGTANLDAGAGHLGMATMHARAETEGGQLTVTSSPGAGTTLTLTLPLSEPDTDTHTGAADHPADAEFLRTIVVCEDHQYLRDAITLVLSSVPRFHVVGEAFNGDTCIEQVRKYRPEVLLLDASMPGGGPRLAKAAKELNPAMHIVVFSGRQDPDLSNAMLGAGADEYIVKTGRLQPLVEALDRAISHQSAPE